MTNVLHALSTTSLRSLAASLRDGMLANGISRFGLQQIAGPLTVELESCLHELMNGAGMTASQIAIIADAIADTRNEAIDPTANFDLVLSGPDVPGIPTSDTAAVMHTLIEEAESQVLLVGYAIHNGQRLFERLAAKMAAKPDLHVVFCLDIPRKYSDTSLASEIVRRFAHEFHEKHWPWPQRPELYYDPRSLSEQTEQRSSLHAKCAIIDKRIALITSANFTEAAQQRNIEAGVLIRYPAFVERLDGYFRALIAAGLLVRCSHI